MTGELRRGGSPVFFLRRLFTHFSQNMSFIKKICRSSKYDCVFPFFSLIMVTKKGGTQKLNDKGIILYDYDFWEWLRHILGIPNN